MSMRLRGRWKRPKSFKHKELPKEPFLTLLSILIFLILNLPTSYIKVFVSKETTDIYGI